MPPSEQSRGLPGWLKVLTAALLLVFLIAMLIYVMGLSATRRWNQLTQILHAKGQPVTLREIEAGRPVIPNDQNSARLLERIIEKHAEFVQQGTGSTDVFTFAKSDDLFGTLERPRLERSRQFLEKHRAVLQDLLPILKLERGRFPLDLSQPAITLLLPNLGPVRVMAKLARLAATLSAIDGQMDQAATQILVQLKVADSFDGEPIVISRLVQMAIERTAGATLEDVLRAGKPSREAIAELGEALDRRLTRAQMQPAFLGERASFIDTCACILDGRMSPTSVANFTGPGTPWFSVLPTLPVWLVRENQIKGTEMLSWLVDAGEDLPALQAAAGKLDIEAPKLSAKYGVVRIMMPSLSRAVTLHIKTIAHLRAARAIVAAEQFRIDHDRLPQSLEELVPDYLAEMPVDPFDGQPLRFKTTEQGIVIYSIDENMFDEGGEVAPTEINDRAPDLGLRLVRPEFRTITIADPPANDADECPDF